MAFLHQVSGDRLRPLFEVLVGCPLRRGEASALRWEDIDIEALSLFLRRTLSDVNDHLVFGKPKTATSRGRSPQVQPTPTARLSAAAAERAAEAATRAVMTPASG